MTNDNKHPLTEQDIKKILQEGDFSKKGSSHKPIDPTPEMNIDFKPKTPKKD